MADQTRQRDSLTLTINDAKEYFKTDPEEGNERQSQPITLCGQQWKMESYREVDDDGLPWLGVYVKSSNDKDEKWRCKATCLVRVRNSLTDDKTFRFCGEFTHDVDNWGRGRSITIQ
ncbi:hypothetical protein AAVH_42894, partial [Aphelenchoides avenae]